jgi:predicted branched-subunit amino acid permease
MFIVLFLSFFDHKRLPNLRMNQGIGFVCLSCSPHVVGFIVKTCDPHVIGFTMQICDVFISMYYEFFLTMDISNKVHTTLVILAL